MLRIHFTAQDLAYVRLARSPDPLWEIVCSLCRLQTDEGPIAFGPWRRAVAAQLRAPGGEGEGAGGGRRAVALALRSLVPCGPYIPDFLTPAVDGGTIDLRQGVDRVLSTPRSRLRRELTLLTESARAGVRGPGAAVPGAPPPRPLRPFAGERLARGDAGALRALGGLLTAYDAGFVAPYRPWIDAAVASDVAWRSRELAAGGVRALLETFRPMARWSPPVLEVAYPVERDLHLAGRGLLLVPSYFCWRRPITLFDAALLPVLVYPVEKPVEKSVELALAGAGVGGGLGVGVGAGGGPKAGVGVGPEGGFGVGLPTGPVASGASLARLLGPTRAALLYEVASRDCATTSELALAVGCSLPNISQQLAILREAGLTACRKEGRCVLHLPTPLGQRLLETAGGGARRALAEVTVSP
ncbi:MULTISPECIES: helix-turn-helix transcriptional regulator [Streptomyces]|uniref:ArsR/SmtB family transcription factor n=1 Tax=Streptomyces TaxID=1883 RepID=UPI001EFE2783|nr:MULTISPECIES: helix-turn-helix domain-containing protein [Streptomyces]MDI7789689.1 helix-turn-helix domain-containing protein [Streptomyces cavourensis]